MTRAMTRPWQSLCGRVGVPTVWLGVVLASHATGGAISVSAAARAIQPGELAVLTITTTVPVEAIRVHAFSRELSAFRVDPTTWRVLVGIDLDVAPQTYPVSIETSSATGHRRVTHDLVVRPKTFPTRTLSVDDAFVNPPATVQARIEQEARDLAWLWDHSAPTRLWSGAFVRPVPEPANSAFGSRSIFNGQPRSPHSGADFPSAEGTPVKAPNAGRVVLARELYFSGNTVVIDHGLGLFSLLAHLSAMDAHDGDLLKAGDVVGRVGATGRVTGPHLHWAVRAGGARVDPLSILAVLF